MEQNKVEIVVAGKSYNLWVADNPAYIERLAQQLNRRIQDMLMQNDTISVFDAAVLVALDILDESTRVNSNIDNIRTQIKTYVDDAAAARVEADRALRELSGTKTELAALQKQAAGLREEIAGLKAEIGNKSGKQD